MRLFASFAIICWTAAAAAAEPVQTTQGVDLTLVSEKSKIAPGETFTVGLKIHHHPRFHTYWQGPGIAGVPTTLKWTLPAGFTTGPARWPAPEQTMMSIHPVHGYERDVMLLTDLTAPADLKPGPLTLKANAVWMACADGCYPGNQDLSVEVTAVATKDDGAADSATAEAFAAARREIPQALSGWTVELASPMGGKEIRLHVAPAEGNAARPERVYFFSEDGQISSEPPQTVTSTSDGGFDIVAERSEFSPQKRPTLPGVLRADVPLLAGGAPFARLEPSYKDAPASAPVSPVEVKTSSTTDGECHCEEEAAAAKTAPVKAEGKR